MNTNNQTDLEAVGIAGLRDQIDANLSVLGVGTSAKRHIIVSQSEDQLQHEAWVFVEMDEGRKPMMRGEAAGSAIKALDSLFVDTAELVNQLLRGKMEKFDGANGSGGEQGAIERDEWARILEDEVDL